MFFQRRTPFRACGVCLFPLPQGFIDDHGALEGAIGIYVTVDVCRGGDVAVAKPLLDQLHLHALRNKEAALKERMRRPCSCLTKKLKRHHGKQTAATRFALTKTSETVRLPRSLQFSPREQGPKSPNCSMAYSSCVSWLLLGSGCLINSSIL